jgi:hypothetical protein
MVPLFEDGMDLVADQIGSVDEEPDTDLQRDQLGLPFEAVQSEYMVLANVDHIVVLSTL